MKTLLRTPAILLLLFSLATISSRADEAASAQGVRYNEGVTHGFLLLSTLQGKTVAHGELLQSSRDGEVKGHMVFRFEDGSLSDETTEFTQHGVTMLKSYHQIQRGPAFPKDVDYRIDRVSATKGRYKAVLKDRKSGDVKTYEDTFDMPADLYNGLIIVTAKNLPEGGSRTVHMLALTPKPRVIRLDVRPQATPAIRHGAFDENVVRYALDPDLGFLLGTAAKLIGKDPPDQHLWLARKEAPGFVKFEGPMYNGGPVWRISLAAPCFPETDSCRAGR